MLLLPNVDFRTFFDLPVISSTESDIKCWYIMQDIHRVNTHTMCVFVCVLLAKNKQLVPVCDQYPKAMAQGRATDEMIAWNIRYSKDTQSNKTPLDGRNKMIRLHDAITSPSGRSVPVEPLPRLTVFIISNLLVQCPFKMGYAAWQNRNFNRQIRSITSQTKTQVDRKTDISPHRQTGTKTQTYIHTHKESSSELKSESRAMTHLFLHRFPSRLSWKGKRVFALQLSTIKISWFFFSDG